MKDISRSALPRFLSRSQIDTCAWDACVQASSQRIVYGYSWYLDAVLPRPDWTWVGLVLPDETGAYQAVMPIPLRRKGVAGVTYDWVVHQPLFCQFLGVFSRHKSFDSAPFLRAVRQRFRYGSTLSLRQLPTVFPIFNQNRRLTTHVLDLTVGYEVIHRNYTADRRANLRRAKASNWNIADSTDPEPLLRLFRHNHANGIEGGVGEWAYDILRNLTMALQTRGLATLRYAVRDGQIDAGALFVQEGNRIIYLFNAASDAGRRGNARTLLIDQLIRERAGQRYADQPIWFDFESPEKPSIVAFYRSFGTVEEPFRMVRWSRLNPLERLLRSVWNAQKKRRPTTDAHS